MKTTVCTEKKEGKKTAKDLLSGGPNLRQNNASMFEPPTESGNGRKPLKSSLLLTRQMAAERLKCHWQTLLYREKKGDLTGIKINGRKYYALEEVEKLIRSNPVINKPHYSKRPVIQTKPTLWNRIKIAIVSFVR